MKNKINAEYQKAVISRGEWKFLPMYTLLMETAEDDWFCKTQQQKKDQIRRVMTARPVLECNESKTKPCSSDNTNHSLSTNVLDVDFENVMITSVARDTLKSIWKKANDLVSSKTDIVIPTWSDNPKARLVKSTSSNVPHFVFPHKKFSHQYCCDEKCPMYQGFRICSHIVATANVNGELKPFLNWYVENNCQPDLLAIGTRGMPKGVGRKGGVPKRKRTRQVPLETSSSRFEHGMSSEPSSSTTFEPPQKRVVPPSLSQTTVPNPSSTSSITGNSMIALNNAPAEVNLSLLTNLLTAVCQSTASQNTTNQHPANQPFTLKLRSNAIKICQSCRQGFTETDVLVIARLERRMVKNMSTGVNILGRESNSHYHAALVCVRKADFTFTGSKLIIPTDVKQNLTTYHKHFLCEQLLVPVTEFQ